MHVGYVKPVAITTPDFIEDLIPLFDRYAINHQPGSRNRFSALVALRRGVVEIQRRPLSHQHLRAIAREGIATDILGQHSFFAILKREDLQLRLAITLA